MPESKLLKIVYTTVFPKNFDDVICLDFIPSYFKCNESILVEVEGMVEKTKKVCLNKLYFLQCCMHFS